MNFHLWRIQSAIGVSPKGKERKEWRSQNEPKVEICTAGDFCVAVLFAIPKAEISAAESNRIVVHHPGKEDGAGAIYRIWKVTGDDEGVAIDELNRTLLPLTEAQLDQRYGDGFDTEPADSSGTTAVNGLSNGRYYIRLRGEYDGKAIYFLLDLPVVKDGTVYRKVDVYPKASDVEDKPGSFELLKKGIDGTEEYPLPGVVFDLYRQDPDSGRWYVYRADLVTDENGKIILSGLPFGWYRLKEKKTPSGYVPAEDTDFNVQPGKRTYVVIDNEKAPPSGGHEFIKVDADDITKPLGVLQSYLQVIRTGARCTVRFSETGRITS